MLPMRHWMSLCSIIYDGLLKFHSLVFAGSYRITSSIDRDGRAVFPTFFAENHGTDPLSGENWGKRQTQPI